MKAILFTWGVFVIYLWAPFVVLCIIVCIFCHNNKYRKRFLNIIVLKEWSYHNILKADDITSSKLHCCDYTNFCRNYLIMKRSYLIDTTLFLYKNV